MVERFKASVLKTDEGQPSGGSNPPLSANLVSARIAPLAQPNRSGLVFSSKNDHPATFASNRPAAFADVCLLRCS